MRKLSHLILFLLLGSSSTHAQDANKVIDQYLKSTGGSNKLSKLLTLGLEGSLTRASDGKTGAFTLDSKSPNRYYLELIVADQLEILAYNGKSAWFRPPQGEAVTLLGQEALQLEAASLLASSHLLNLKKNKIGIALIGPARLAAHDTIQVELTMPTGIKRQLYFDSASHLLVKESGLTGGVPQEIIYEAIAPKPAFKLLTNSNSIAAKKPTKLP
jgi:hypothetical protein